jgi:hypothetical protein
VTPFEVVSCRKKRITVVEVKKGVWKKGKAKSEM